MTPRDLNDALEAERRRLASDLHDGPGQLLCLVRLRLTLLEERVPRSLRAELAELGRIVDDTVHSLQSLSFRLQPPALENGALGPAMRRMTADLEHGFGLRVTLEDAEAFEGLDPEARGVLFRSLRELLTNVAKHAGTRRARVVPIRIGRMLHVLVEDRGCGVEAPDGAPPAGGFGLTNIERLLANVGGRLSFEPVAEGTRARVEIPLRSPSESIA